ncbi:interferon regulatory factor 2-like isoform X1 [Oncorhynchus keta]|uniref:interferon regulatory factor 2-like isoform X1 n=1 Tax=Oncorhynchus keta TaxID=8018 RepID=UPI0015F88260|nr:interferon regulatory factor 2-like isoform X1 [Oncorhynchus keta]
MPVERMRMRPWLEEQINSCLIPGLKWVNREKRIFQIPWMHAARHGWDLEKDAPLFKNWAIHTGKYQLGIDKPDPKTWKANFRCAMNSLPDIEEVKDKSIKKGTNAFRVYKMLSVSERQTKKGKKRREKEGKNKEQVEPRSSSMESMNGSVEDHEVVRIEVKDDVKEEYITDCTASSEFLHPGSRSPGDDQLIIDDLPYVCQTIEVTTENEEQSVSSSHPYPLQISPVSSYGESDTDSVHSEEDSKEHLHGGLWGSSLASSVLRVPSCSLPSMATFVTTGKVTNFKVTSTRDPMPLISYNNSPWKRDMPAALHPPSEQASSSQASAAETRASVIMKTSDISKSSVKTC